VTGYVRVSTEEQHATGVGLDAQRDAINTECSRRGWSLASIEEDVLSGKSLNRPGLQAALASVRSGDAGTLVVAKLDRLSRSIVDFAGLLDDARKRGYNIAVIDLGLDLSTPQGELVGNVIASVAQWERRIIGQRTKEALVMKRTQGVRLGRPPALTAAVVERIREERSEGRTLAAIADALNTQKVATGHGGLRWYPATVRAVINRATPIDEDSALE
jgi:DNA invertase Pin-like site-specific DNA recombinase